MPQHRNVMNIESISISDCFTTSQEEFSFSKKMYHEVPKVEGTSEGMYDFDRWSPIWLSLWTHAKRT